MTLQVYRTIINVCPILLKPIIKILLKAGINYKQFATMTRSLFVDVATNEFGIDGRETNTSRVAILTGISRSEVTKIKKSLATETSEIKTSLSNATRLLSAWHSDPEFIDESGQPKILAIKPVGETNFSTLMKKYGGDIPDVAMLKELKKSESIAYIDEDHIKVLKRYYMPPQFDVEHLFRVGYVIADLSNTLHHNMVREADEKSRFEGRVSNTYISPKILPKFHEFIDQEGELFLEKIDSWLSKHESKEASDKEIRLGMGLYFIQDN